MGCDRSTSPGQWTRRQFVRGAAGVLALPGLRPGHSQQFAYVAGGEGSLLVFSVRGDEWTLTQRVPSRSPAYVVLSKTQRTLYVANDVDTHDGLPRGTVEVYTVDALDGRLTRSGLIPLSLSATNPRQMALSPNGRLLAVAAYGGGVYNVLPIADDETPGRPEQIFKDIGCGVDSELQSSAHPHSLHFDGSARLLATDFGSDRVSSFSMQDGRLVRQMQRLTGENSGPAACVLHSRAATLYVWHTLASSLACYRYESGTVGDSIQRISFANEGEGALALHPSGRVLYTAQSTGLRAWRVDGSSGKLSSAQRVSLAEVRPVQIVASPDGESVYILGGGSIAKFSTDRVTGALSGQRLVALLHEPKHLALRTI